MIFDLIVFTGLLISCGIAFLRGFIREALTIFGMVGGGVAAVAGGPALSPVFRQMLGVKPNVEVHKYLGLVPADRLADILAYGVIFLLVVLVCAIISHFLSGWAKAIGLGPLNRAFGVLFGVVRAVLLLSLIYLPIYLWTAKTDRDQWSWMQGSHTRIYIETVSNWMAGLIPASVTTSVDSKAAGALPVVDMTRKLQDLDVLRKLGAPGAAMPPATTAPPPATTGPAPVLLKPQGIGGPEGAMTTPATPLAAPGGATATTPAPAPYAQPEPQDIATPADGAAPPPMPAQPTAPVPPDNGGYQNDQRQDMKSLIDKGLNDLDDR